MHQIASKPKYRTAYLLGDQFEKQMFTIYSGMQTIRRPPYLEDLFTEMTANQSVLLLEKNKHLFQGDEKNLREWNELFSQVWSDDSTAKFEVLECMSDQDAQGVIQDIYLYMNYNHLSYLIRDHPWQSLFYSTLIHSPVIETW